MTATHAEDPAAVPAPCARCGAVNATAAKFCSECGAAVQAQDAERRLVSVLFSDVAGFTAMSERLEPDDVHAVMTTVFERMTKIITSQGGRVDKLMGDAVLAVFGDPVAHEDDADRAVRAAIAMHATMSALSAELQDTTGCVLGLHSGINSGVAVTGGAEVDGAATGPLGDTVNVAARLQSLAERGEILIGPETVTLLRGQYELEDAGSHELKGKADTLRVTRVRGSGGGEAQPSRREATFVGRVDELVALEDAFDDLRLGTTVTVCVTADPGAGKTRLFEELRSRVATRWLEGRAYPDSTMTPYAVVVDLVRRVVGIEESDTAFETVEKIRRSVTDAKVPLSALAPLLTLFDLESAETIEPEWFEHRLLEALGSLIDGLGADAHTVVCLQDLHWADAASLRVASNLAGVVSTPFLLLTNTRPGAELPGDGVRRLTLSPLAEDTTRDLVTSLLDGDAPSTALLDFIGRRAEGNPFFIEESVNSLIETGVLARGDGIWQVTRPIDELELPSSIRALIASRIDRLDADRRRLLREAAVVGRQFLYDIVRHVNTASDDLDAALADLTVAQFIRENERREELEYIFKHALTQEVAYDGLVKHERRRLHARAGAAIEAVLGDRIAEYVETLAHHFSRAGDTDKAAKYLAASGQKALDRFALTEAISYYAQAAALIEGDAERDHELARIVLAWCDALYLDGNLNDIEALLSRHAAVFGRIDDPEAVGLYHAKAALAAWAVIDYHDAVRHCEAALALADEHDLGRVRTHVLPWLGFCFLALGRTDELAAIAEVPLHESEKDPLVREAAIVAAAGRCMVAMSTGELDECERVARALIAHGQATNQSRATVLGLVGLGQWHASRLDPDAAIVEAENARAAVRDPMINAWVLGWMAAFQAQAGRFDEMADTVARLEAHHAVRPLEWCESTMRASSGGVLMVEGDLSRGMSKLRAELDLHDARDDRWIVSYLRMMLGETYARIATREVRASLGALVRNAGFVVRHALPADRHAQQELERARTESHAIGLYGFDGRIALALAKLHVARRRPEPARREVTACLEFLHARDLTVPDTVAALARTLDVSA